MLAPPLVTLVCISAHSSFVGRSADDIHNGFPSTLAVEAYTAICSAMSAIRTAILYLIKDNAEMFEKVRYAGGYRQGLPVLNLRWFQPEYNKCNQAGNIGRVKDDNHMLHIRAVSFHVLTEFFGNGGIAF